MFLEILRMAEQKNGKIWMTERPDEPPTDTGITQCPDFLPCEMTNPLLFLPISITYSLFAAESIPTAVTANMLA